MAVSSDAISWSTLRCAWRPRLGGLARDIGIPLTNDSPFSTVNHTPMPFASRSRVVKGVSACTNAKNHLKPSPAPPIEDKLYSRGRRNGRRAVEAARQALHRRCCKFMLDTVMANRGGRSAKSFVPPTLPKRRAATVSSQSAIAVDSLGETVSHHGRRARAGDWKRFAEKLCDQSRTSGVQPPRKRRAIRSLGQTTPDLYASMYDEMMGSRKGGGAPPPTCFHCRDHWTNPIRGA
jgi:hypothetical protein